MWNYLGGVAGISVPLLHKVNFQQPFLEILKMDYTLDISSFLFGGTVFKESLSFLSPVDIKNCVITFVSGF
jgi:hypothetical protein